MLSVDYDADQGWHDMKIVPYAPFEISPAAQGLHYGQAVLKALKPINIMERSCIIPPRSKLQTY